MAGAGAKIVGGPSLKLSSGYDMPQVGLGTWNSPKGAVEIAVYHALKSGYRHLDCAAVYGNEKEVGAGMKRAFEEGICKREDVFITSKLWVANATKELASKGLSQTLEDLGVEYIDLYLIHWPYFLKEGATIPFDQEMIKGYSSEHYAEVWSVLEEEVSNGRVRSIGTSNMSKEKLSKLLETAKIPPAVNQVERHPYLQQEDLLDFCKSNNIVITAYSPLGSPGRPARVVNEGDPSPMHDEHIKAIAHDLKKSPAQVLIRWAIQSNTTVIPKSTTPERIEQNFDVFDFELSKDQMDTIAKIDMHWRLLRGGIFLKPGQTWTDLWENETEKFEAKKAAREEL